MFTTKTYLKKNKLGNVLKNIREHYLRDDVFCGSELCNECRNTKTALPANTHNKNGLCKRDHYIVLDTNIILDQIDILDEDDIKYVIILQTVYQEVSHRSLPVIKRLKSIMDNPNRHFYIFANEHHKDTYFVRDHIESVNDYNDKLIRNACKWYQQHLPDVKILLLTDDAANAKLAKEDNILAVSMREYIQHIKSNANLQDKLAKIDYHQKDDGKEFYPAHLTDVQIHSGIKSGKLQQGVFRASRENYLEGFVNVEGKDHTVLLQGRQCLNRAVDGDVVAVELFAKDNWSCPSDVVLEDETTNIQEDEIDDVENNLLKKKSVKKEDIQPTGRIVGIIRRKWRQYCGIIHQESDDSNISQLFIPAEKKIPKIRIETRQTEVLKKQKIIVAIDSWPRYSRYPHGHLVRALGKIGDRNTENEVLLLENDVPHSHFSEEVNSCLPSLPWIITDQDFKERVDLRELDICSVDPPGCTDIDDALHCRSLPNGNLEVGVHIADVSHFIRPGTAIDLEAASRGTTVYLVDMRIDMVPELLSSNLCSLRGGVERFALSCIWEMNKAAEIINVKFHKSIINSKRAMTYEEAQMKIDDKSQTDSLTESLRNLNKLAKILKKKRIAAGALLLASPEIRFQVDDETHDPIDVQAKKVFETNSMVEEFMLLANISVAEKILTEFPDCAILRRHPEPPLSNFEPLIKAGRHMGFEIDTSCGKELANSLDRSVKPDNPYFNTLLRILATRCMLQAVYFVSGMHQKEEYKHYGLAVPLYTHFTSPIRRYADVLVHRLLAACIGADSLHPDLLDKNKMQDICQNLNYRNRMAQYAGRGSVALNTHKLWYRFWKWVRPPATNCYLIQFQLSSQMFFRDKVQEVEGYILSVRKNAFLILIPKFGLESILYLPKTESPVKFIYSDENFTQQCGDIILHAFDPVTIRLSLNSSNIQHQKLVTDLISPKIEGFSVLSIKELKRKGSDTPVREETEKKGKKPTKKTRK